MKDGITKSITTRSLTYLTKRDQVQVITKNITGGNRLNSTKMEQTDNITKHLSASNIPSSTMTSKKMDQVQIITKTLLKVIGFTLQGLIKLLTS